jgi:CHAD domain-containing protein
MAVIIPLPAGIRPEHRGLTFWMERVLIELEHVRESPEPDTVHDLRVALRRCRSMAAAMEEVDPHPAWAAMREAGRKLFRRLGALRDVQVQEEWVKKLAPEGNALRNVLLSRLEESEKSRKNEALRIVGRFDRKSWKGLARTLRPRVRIVPAGGAAAECLALERFGEAHELHRRALRTERAKPWHRLRIGVKRFRYTVEGFLPTHYASWSEDLKRVQDLLGEVHDLDVLLGMVKENAEATLAVERGAWEERIELERHARIETYRQLTLGTTSLWNTWRLGLPSNGQLEAAAMARIEATARAADPRLRRTMQAARIARAVGEAFRRAKMGPVFTEEAKGRVFLAAARLHGVRPEGFGGTAQKAARKFLASLPVPAGWTEQEWQVVTLTVRYHRGAEPKPNRGRVAKLGEEQQKEVFMLAGVLRLGRALQKIGVSSLRGIRAENGPEAIVLTVPEIPDSPEVSARLAAAKHLLERGLGKAVLLRTAAASEKVLSLPVRTEGEAVLSTESAS